MSDASSALAGLGSDLAFTISFAIARELLDGANEAGVSQDELVAVVLALGVIFAALPRTAVSIWRFAPSILPWSSAAEAAEKVAAEKKAALALAAGNQSLAAGAEPAKPAAPTAPAPHENDPSGLGEFLRLVVDMGKRISVSVCVQLLASNVRSKQPLRSVRIVLLFGVVFYFLFLDAMGTVNTRKRGS